MKQITRTKSITLRDVASLKSYYKDVAKTTPLSLEEELALGTKIQSGDLEARNKLVMANLRFVITVAKQYQGYGLTLEDLIAEGSTGLIRAAELYDPSKNMKFITYAVWWIRQSILKALSAHSSDIRLPGSQIDPISAINKAVDKYEQINHVKPSDYQISELTGIPEDKIQEFMSVNNKAASINEPIGNSDDGSTLESVIEGDCDSTDFLSEQRSIIEEINRILDKLPDKEHDILCLYYGLKGLTPMKYEEIGKLFNISSERVRQLKRLILSKCKAKYAKYFDQCL